MTTEAEGAEGQVAQAAPETTEVDAAESQLAQADSERSDDQSPQTELPSPLRAGDAADALEPDGNAARSERPTASQKYGIDRLVLLVRSSGRAFTYWEIDPARLGEGGAGQLRLVDARTGATLASAPVDPAHGRHHFPLDGEAHDYLAQLVLVRSDGTEELLSEGRPAEIPPVERASPRV